MATRLPETDRKLFLALWVAFTVQVLGRLLDLQWHLTHSEFETGADQVRAHWLVWLGTILVLVVAVWALRTGAARDERSGYLVTLVANVLYAGVAVIHFVQHLNRLEVEWAHVALAVTSLAAAGGVLWVTASRIRTRNTETRAAL